MSLNFLIVDNNKETREQLKNNLIDGGHTAYVSDHGHQAIEIFNEVLPNMIIMSFEDVNTACQNTEKMIEIDHTACIFGIVSEVTPAVQKKAFAAGARALIESESLMNGKESVEEILLTLGSACSELKDGQCIKCWEVNRYLDVTPLQ